MATRAFKLHSPLDSLAHRTSAPKEQVFTSAKLPPDQHNGFQHPYTQPSYTYDLQMTPERRHAQDHHQHSPTSPLLHSHFARDSTATASSNDKNSYFDSIRTSIDSRNVYQDPELEYRYYDDESIYSNNTGPALRDSWRSAATSGTARREISGTNVEGTISDIYHMRISQEPPAFPPSPTSPVPTVIVSSPSESDMNSGYTGRMPIIRPTTTNFSRPARPPISPPNDEQKRRVLERNARRTPSPSSSHHPSKYQDQRSTHPSSNLQSGINSTSLSAPYPMDKRPRSPTSTQVGHNLSPHIGLSPTHSSYSAHPSQATGLEVAGSTNSLALRSTPISITLPNRPPSLRPGSPASLYSTYSFYQLDSAAPSPTGSEFNGPSQATSLLRASPPPLSPTLSSLNTSKNPTAQEYLQLGIQHHEANRLTESAVCFERSAKEEGGCGVGMLMWGLTLRHGWGCEKNEKLGFKWLRRAAESAVEDLENARGGGGMDPGVVQTELVLAIYEVGQCFFQGWGVARDQKMAVSYYMVAARLGDPDAQSDLAFCLANGKGCKKDRKEAAKWYRAAVAQGQSDIGLAWIYKDKYQ